MGLTAKFLPEKFKFIESADIEELSKKYWRLLGDNFSIYSNFKKIFIEQIEDYKLFDAEKLSPQKF